MDAYRPALSPIKKHWRSLELKLEENSCKSINEQCKIANIIKEETKTGNFPMLIANCSFFIRIILSGQQIKL